MYCPRSLLLLLPLIGLMPGAVTSAEGAGVPTSAATHPASATPKERCVARMASVENARSFRPAEPEPSPRTLLMDHFRSAPRVFATGEVKLSTTPAVAWSHFSVSPAEDIRILEDCGDGLVVVAVSRSSTYGPYLEGGYVLRDKLSSTPATCSEIQTWAQGAVFQRVVGGDSFPPRVVITTSTQVHSLPVADARVVQLLGYGIPLRLVSDACEGWSLVGTSWGIGFVPVEDTADHVLTEAELNTRIDQSVEDIHHYWLQVRAHYFPTTSNLEVARTSQTAQRKSIPPGQAPCATYFGVCRVLAKESIKQVESLPADPGLARIPLSPWWVLPSATAPAEMAFFRAAYVNTSLGDCNCCGCDSCQTTLSLEFERLGVPGQLIPSPLGASRVPPSSWFRSVSTDGCKTAEQIAMASPRWDVPGYGGDVSKPARRGEGSCVAGENGSVWWQQPWHHPELADQESDVVFRSYRIAGGKVVATGPLSVSSSTGNTTLTQSTELLYAWRDFDGDGDAEALWRCSYGGYCRKEEQPTR